MLRRIIGEHIDLSFNLDAKGEPYAPRSGQVVQIILHLAVNARDTMPDGGRLVVAQSAEAHTGVQAGPHVILAVSDTGTGMTRRKSRLTCSSRSSKRRRPERGPPWHRHR